MTRETITTMLAEVSKDAPKGDVYSFAEEDQISMMCATDGAVLTVNEINALELKDGIVVARCERSQTYVLELERVIGFKVKRAAPKSTGFTAG